MKRFTAILAVLVALLAPTTQAQNYGLNAYMFSVTDELGQTVTDSVTLVPYITGAGAATVYSTPGMAAIGTTLTARTDGVFRFWYGGPDCDVIVTNNVTGNAIKITSLDATDNRIILGRNTDYFAAAAHYTGTLTVDGASTFTGNLTLGVDATGVDFLAYGDTTLNNMLWDMSEDRLEFTAADILMDDNADVIFGTGLDFTIQSDTAATLDILPITTDESSVVVFGADTSGVDVQIFGATTVNYLLFDASDDRLEMVSADIFLDDNSDLILGTGLDFTIECDTATKLEILPITTDESSTVVLGADTSGVDLQVFGATTVNYMLFDASDDRLEMVAADILFDDNADIIMGTGLDFTIECDTNKTLEILPVVTDSTAVVNIGVDAAGADLKLFGETTGEYWLWDASADDVIANCNSVLHTTTQTTADQFKVDATGVVAGVAINLETTDGQILLNADGVTNGDVVLNAEEDITLTAGDDVTMVITDALGIVSASATISTGAITVTTTNPGVDFVTNTSKTHKFAYGGIGYVSATVISTTGICRASGVAQVGLAAGGTESFATEGYTMSDTETDFIRFSISIPPLFVANGAATDLVLYFDIEEQAAEECNIDVRIFQYGDTSAEVTDTLTVADSAARGWVTLDTLSTGIGALFDADDVLMVEVTSTAGGDDFDLYGVRLKYNVGIECTQ